MRTILVFAILAFECLAAFPTLSFVTCGVPKNALGVSSATSIQCHWIASLSSTNVIKFGPNGGPYGGTPGTNEFTRNTSGIGNSLPHGALVDGLLPETAYYFVVCSANAGDETCSSQQTATTGAAPSTADQQPIAPTAVDVSWTAGTGAPSTVVGNCNDPTTGLQARYNAASNNAKIIIPASMLACGTMLKLTSSKSNILITTDSTNRPPAGVRDDCINWTCSVMYRTYRDYRFLSLAAVNALTGRITTLATNLPGTIVYAQATTTWAVKKAALDGVQTAITNATNATPIVITANGHGFSNGEVACIKGVLGNLAANGCFTVSSASTDTFALVRSDGSNQAGSGAYVSGGVVEGLAWQTITPVLTSATLLDGTACVTPGSWARYDTGSMNADQGQYRCGTDLLWYKIDNKNTSGTDANGTDFVAAINLDVNAAYIRVEGIRFAELPIPPEVEYNYGPRGSGGASADTIPNGLRSGGIYYGALGTHHVELNQVAMTSDAQFNRPTSFASGDSVITGYTTNLEVRNSSLVCSGVGLAYLDGESPCVVLGTTNSAGPVGFNNNYCESTGGWCIFIQEGFQMNLASNYTVTKNTIKGSLAFNFGSIYYTADTGDYGPLQGRYRQLAEWKTVDKLKFDGNTVSGLPVSITTVASAVEVGSQLGPLTAFSIATDGTVTVNAQRPAPAMAVDDRVMVYGGTGTTPNFIARVASISPFVLKLLDGSTYNLGTNSFGNMCQIDMPWQVSNIAVTNNYFERLAVPSHIFGNSYQSGADVCQPGPAGPYVVENNLARIEAISQTGGTTASTVNTTGAWIAGFVDYSTIKNNTAICQDSAASTNESGFVTDFDAVNFKGTGLDVVRNLLCAQDAGVLGNAIAGSAALDQRWVNGSTFTQNAFVATPALSSSGQPAGQVYPMVSQVDYAPSGVPKYSSTSYLAYGVDLAALNRARGIISNPRIETADTQIVVRFTGPIAGTSYAVESSTDGGTTWARVNSTGSAFEQAATISATTKTVYALRILAPNGPLDLGNVRTK